MKLRWSLLLWAALSCGITGISLATANEEQRGSVILGVDAATSTVIILWPVMLGVVAGDALRRAESWGVVEGFPLRGRWRSVAGIAARHGGAAASSITLASLIGAGVGMAQGSVVTLSAFRPLPWAIGGFVACSLLGAGAGALKPAVWMPPALTLGSYGILAFDVAHAQFLTSFTGATSTGPLFTEYVPSGLALLASALALISGAGVLLVAGAVYGSRWPIAGACALIMASVPVWALGNSSPLYEPVNASGWPCDTSEGVAICVPEDQGHRLDGLAQQLRPRIDVVARLDPTAIPKRIDIGLGAWSLPYEDSVGDPYASTVAFGVSTCFALENARSFGMGHGDRMTDDELSAAFDEAAVLEAWIVEGMGEQPDGDIPPPTTEQARSALAGLRSCR